MILVADFTDAEIQAAVTVSEIAGGQVYRQKYPHKPVTRNDADVTVSTADELIDEAESRPRGAVVWIAGGESTRIDLTDRDIGGVQATIAGNRGEGGSKGPLVYTDSKGTNSTAYLGGDAHGQIELHDGGRLTGFRLRGGVHDNWDNPAHPGYVEYRPDEGYSHYFSRGVSTYGNGIEIDNMEIYGWGAHGVAVGNDGYEPEIHHNHLHNTMLTSSGYGVRVTRGRPHVHHNYFNAHRHAIAGEGYVGCSYVVEDNVFGPSTSSHEVDQHGRHNNTSGSDNWGSKQYYGQAGSRMEIRRNTFTATHVISDANFDSGNPTWSVSIRGVPWPRDGDGVIIENNHFPHPEITTNAGGAGVRDWDHGGAYNQQYRSSGSFDFSNRTQSDGFTANYKNRNNRYNGASAGYVSGMGAPIDLNDPSLDDDIRSGLSREQLRTIGDQLREVHSDLGDVHAILTNED